MPKAVASLVAALVAAYAAIAPGPARADPPSLLTIRSTSTLPDAVQAVLAEVARPNQLSVRRGQNVEEFLRSVCGSTTVFYRQRLFAMLNDPLTSPLLPQATDRDRTVPACPWVRRNVRDVAVLAGEDLAALLRRTSGADAGTLVETCAADGGNCIVRTAREALAAANRRSPASLDRLREGEVLQIPFVSQPTTVFLRNRVTPDEAERRLLEAAGNTPVGRGLLRIERGAGYALHAALGPGDAMVQPAGCALQHDPPPRWPFDAEALRMALRAVDDRPGAPPPRRVTIRVADTGISAPHLAEGFPKEAFLLVNNRVVSGRQERADRPNEDRDGNGYRGDRLGVTADQDGDLEPPRNALHPWHGAEVVHLALGGRAFRDATPGLDRRLAVTFARVFTERAGESQHAATAAGLVASLRAWSDSEALRPTVVNLSVGGPAPIADFAEALRDAVRTNRLVVMAAGNQPRSLADRAEYPASHAADPSVTAVTLVVGAHGPTGERAAFSAFGRERVDLLAPGCRLARSADPEGDPLAGTSFAAPLASFAAGLLFSAMPDATPARVRERLWATARHVSDEVAREVRFGGVLDLPAALRLFDDVLRRRDNSLVTGRWREPAQELRLCADGPALDAFRVMRVRVVRAEPGTRAELSLLLRGAEGQPIADERSCAAAEPGLRFAAEGEGERLWEWREIAAFVPALDLADRRGGPPPEVVAAAREQSQAHAVRAVSRDAVLELQRARGEPPTGRPTPFQAELLRSQPRLPVR